MRKNRRADDRAWLALAWCAALPAGIGLVVAVAAALAGCGRAPPDDPPAQPLLRLRCEYSSAVQTTCVVNGRRFACTRGDSAWRCAETR